MKIDLLEAWLERAREQYQLQSKQETQEQSNNRGNANTSQ
jgi:hypothetical protein